MHEWHTSSSTNILQLINEFLNYTFSTDHGEEKVRKVKIFYKIFTNEEVTRTYITDASYGSDTACLAAYTDRKVTKAFIEAFTAFKSKWEDYNSFKDNLTIAYGRTSDKVTCPNCHSAINLHYGKYYKVCPVCGSKKIISDSNWKTLDTKYRLVEKASDALMKIAVKNGVLFMCGIEWHC